MLTYNCPFTHQLFPQGVVGNSHLKESPPAQSLWWPRLRAGGTARRGARLKPVSVSGALGSEPGGAWPASLMTTSSQSLCMCGFVCVCVSVWVFVVVGFVLFFK